MSGQAPCSLGSECVKCRQLLGDGTWQLETHLEHPGVLPPTPRIPEPWACFKEARLALAWWDTSWSVTKELVRGLGRSRPKCKLSHPVRSRGQRCPLSGVSSMF